MTHLLASDDLFAVEPPLKGGQLKERLQFLIHAANPIAPFLAHRVEEIYRGVRDVKPGSLVAKRVLSAFLLQFISDATVWLSLESVTKTEREKYLAEMNPTERYWYETLFPKWLQENDEKFYTWKQKIRQGVFTASDTDIIQVMANGILNQEGAFLQRYVADLSMATDLVVSRHSKQPLCVQITSLSPEYIEEKYRRWKRTLLLWKIDRGLFISYNPSSEGYVNRIVNLALYNSDNLASGNYLKYCF